MRRIGLAVVLAVSLVLASLIAEGQQAGKVYRLGFLSSQTAATLSPMVNPFSQKLRDLGYAEGRNLVIEYGWAEGRYERFPALARELVRLDVEVIVTPDGVPPALAAKAATRTRQKPMSATWSRHFLAHWPRILLSGCLFTQASMCWTWLVGPALSRALRQIA
jgi:ABC-type uncharacterized transport system substrate-binding protein